MKKLMAGVRIVFLSTALVFLFNDFAFAQTFICNVTKKFNAFTGENYTQQALGKWKFSVHLETQRPAKVSRCSYSTIEKAVTCDRYLIDKIEKSKAASITKYYYFNGQFDLQVFENQTFLENNGRGSIATGKCTLKN